MSEEGETDTEAPRRSRLPLIAGLGLAIVLAGGGFYATYTGLASGSSEKTASDSRHENLPPVSYVAVEPIIVSLAESTTARNLRFRAHLEVTPSQKSNVESLMPRILDVLNGYLRAIDAADLERSTALIRMRGQMLRRVQLAVGEGRVRDLLVTEFVLN